MQNDNARRPSGTGLPHYSLRGPQHPRPSIVTNSESLSPATAFNSPTSPQATTPDAINFYRTRPLPSMNNVTPRDFPSGNYAEVGANYQRSIPGPPLRKTSSNTSIGLTARSQNASFRDLVAKFDQSQEEEDSSTRVKYLRSPSGPGTENKDWPNESFLNDPSALSNYQQETNQSSRHDAPKQAEAGTTESVGRRYNRERSPINAVSANFANGPPLQLFQPDMFLANHLDAAGVGSAVSQDYQTRHNAWNSMNGGRMGDAENTLMTANGLPHRIQRRVSEAVVTQSSPFNGRRPEVDSSKFSSPSTPSYTSGSAPKSPRSPRSPRSPGSTHQRSISDFTNLSGGDRTRRSPGTQKTSPTSGYASTNDNLSPTSSRSRIPVRNTQYMPFEDNPRSAKRSRSDLVGETERLRVYRRSITPPGRFYSTKFETNATPRSSGGERVKAIITAPAVKNTPPLRSSRPRQHVSTARSISPMIGGQHDEGAASPLHADFTPNASTGSASSRNEQDNLVTRLSNAVNPRNALKLTLDMKGIAQVEDQGLKTGVTEFEEDELNPDMPGSFPDSEDLNQMPPVYQVLSGSSQDHANLASFEDPLAEHSQSNKEQFAQSDEAGTQVLDKIMELRQRSSVLLSGVLGSLPASASSNPTNRSMAGPTRPSMSPRRVTTSLASGNASPVSGSESPVTGRSPIIQPTYFGFNSSTSEHNQLLPVRSRDEPGQQSSIRPTSAWQAHERLYRSKTESSLGSPVHGLPSHYSNAVSRTPSATGSPAKGGFLRTPSRGTLDSDSYSVINRVLDQYSETGVVSAEMVHTFQQHILETDPDLAARSDVDSMSIARAALEDLVRDHSHSHLFGSSSQPNLVHSHSQSDVFSNSSSHVSQPPTPKKYDLSPPTVRKMTSAALQSLNNTRQDLYSPERRPESRESPQPGPTFAHEFRPRHYSTTEQMNANFQASQPPLRNSLDEQGPTPPPKDFRLPRSAVMERPRPNEPRHLIDRVPPRQSSNSRSSNKPVLPEIVSTGGGLGLWNTPRPSQDSTGGQRPNSATYGHTASYASGTGSHLAPVSATPSSQAATPTTASTTESVRTLSGQPATESLPNGQATPATSFTQPPSARSTESPIPTASIERVSTSTETTPDQRRLTKRRHLIKELVDTEFSFNQDMKVIEDIYKGTASAVEALTPDDRRVLFGNSAQIVEFSEAFLDTLKQAATSVYVMPRTNKWRIKRGSISKPPSTHDEQASVASTEHNDEERDRKTYIGEAFGQHMTRMEKVYGDYLRNHDLANQRLGKLQNVPQVSLWLNECHTYASDITSAWDLDSLLVKPVQRILKYPLLLKSLLEATPNDHPDFSALEIAVKQMMDVSHRINESKKRAELLEQVVNKPAKRKELDMSTALSKVFGGRNDKIKQQVNLADAVEDPEYKAISEKFGGQFFQLQVVMRDMEMYKKSTESFVKQFNSYIEAIEEMIDVGHHSNPDTEAKWRRLALTIREMTAIAYMDHEATVQRYCIDPMATLLKLHEAPQKLMNNRKKRIVEYAQYLTKKNRGERLDKKTQQQGEQFIALNETLKEELPKLFSLTAKLVQSCLRNYVDIQVQWHATWQRKIKGVLKEQQIPKDLNEIVEAFNADFASVNDEFQSMSLLSKVQFNDGSSMMSSAASTLLGTEESSIKRPSMQQSMASYSSAPGHNYMNHSPLMPDSAAGFDRRSVASSSATGLQPAFNSPRASHDTNRQSSHIPAPVDAHSPQHARLRTMSSSSSGSPAAINATPIMPPQRLSASQTVAYGPYSATATPASNRPSTATSMRPPTATNRNPAAIAARLSASSAKSATSIPTPTSPNFARNSNSALYSMPSYSRQRSTPSTPDMNTPQIPSANTSGGYSSAFPSAAYTPASAPAAMLTAAHQRAPPPSSGLGGMAALSRSVRPMGHDSGYAASSRTQEDERSDYNQDLRGGQGQSAAGQQEYKVLFLAASLFEFNIDKSRKESGYPYLTYVPGEVFDVIGEKGELWLAKNQDDSNSMVGWIWEKHFAKLMPDGS